MKSRQNGKKNPTRQAARVGKPKKSAAKSAPVSKTKRAYVVRDPQVRQQGEHVIVSHREFVQDVSGSVLLVSTGLPINAGRDTLFPWLSAMALRYEKYQFNSLKFIYEPRCSTATAGTVILAVDYDPLDGAPVSKQVAYSYHGTAQCGAWDECCMTSDPLTLRSRGLLFTRGGAIPAGSDLKTYDLGNLWACTSGFSGTDVCGELFVEYTVTLTLPQTVRDVQSGSYTSTAGLAAGSMVGTNAVIASSSLLDFTCTNASTVTFNQDWYGMITYKIVGTGLVAGGFVSTGTSVCALTASGEVCNAAGTNSIVTCYVANPTLRGKTIINAITATTVTGITAIFSPLV